MDLPPAAADDPELQLLDGPEELQGMHARSELIALVHTGAIPRWARVFDPATMSTITVADIPGVDDLPAGDGGPVPTSAQLASQTPFAPGVESDGWRCERALGSSTGGTRFRAGAVGTQQQATIVLVDGPDAMQRCQKAAEISAAIDSPFLARVVEATMIGGQPALVLESCDGVDIASQIDEGYRFSLHDMRRIARQCGEVLWAACKQGWVHATLSPECVIWTRRGTICLLDLGLAHPSAPGISPEQAQGAAPDHRSDVYALGAILYAMLSGTRITKHQQVQPLAAVRADLPQPTVQAIDRCLQADPAARYQSVMDLVRDLDDQDDPASAQPGRTRSTVAQLPPPQRPSSSGPMALLVLVLLAGLLGGGAYLAWRIVNTPDPQASDSDARTRAQQPDRPALPDPGPAPDPDPVEVVDNGELQPAEEDPFVVLGRYQQAREAEDWPTAWQAARRVLEHWPHLSADMRLLLPLRIVSQPPGATVWIDEQRAGTTPMVWFHDPADNPIISLDAAGHRLATQSANEATATDWRWSATLALVPGERWRHRFAGPLRGQMATGQGEAIMLDRHGHLLGYDDAGVLRSLTLGGDGPVTGPIIWRRQAFCLIGDTLHAIDLGDFRAAWRLRLNPSPRQVPWLVAGEHELMPGRAKLHFSDGATTLITVMSGRDQGQLLARNRLERPISAPVALIATGAGSSALTIPMGASAQVFDGASFDQRRPPERRQSYPLAMGIHHAPLTCWIDRRPHVLLIDGEGSAQLFDLTGAQQAIARWALGARAASAPALLGDSSLVVIALADQRLALLDLQRPGAPEWLTARHPGPLLGAPVAAADRIVYATTDGTVTTVAKTSGDVISQMHPGTRLAAAPVIIGDRVILSTDNGFVLGIDLHVR